MVWTFGFLVYLAAGPGTSLTSQFIISCLCCLHWNLGWCLYKLSTWLFDLCIILQDCCWSQQYKVTTAAIILVLCNMWKWKAKISLYINIFRSLKINVLDSKNKQILLSLGFYVGWRGDNSNNCSVLFVLRPKLCPRGRWRSLRWSIPQSSLWLQ